VTLGLVKSSRLNWPVGPDTIVDRTSWLICRYRQQPNETDDEYDERRIDESMRLWDPAVSGNRIEATGRICRWIGHHRRSDNRFHFTVPDYPL